MLSSDRPLTDPGNDRLGYSSFASNLAESICKMTPPEGLVIALYGPWGSGKSTLLGFVEHYLLAKVEIERPVIVKFNPWWFSGHENLAQRFFEQLQTSIEKLPAIGKQIATKIANLADTLAPANIPYLSELLKPVGGVARAISQPKNVPDAKIEAAKAIKSSGKRLLIMVDDIDRLSADEIRQLFTVVKAIADFPQVIYLLAFDRQVVERALEGVQGPRGGSGAEYLDKIVQVPLELPLPDKAALQRLFLERVNAVIGEFPDELRDEGRSARMFFGGVDYFLDTPRDIFRISNALTVTYPVVRDEVNPYDFVALEALRIFTPIVYNTIRTNKDLFAGSARWRRSIYLPDDSTEGKKAFYDDILNQLSTGEREPVKRILLALFPKLEVVWGGMGYGSDWERTWRKTLRICSSARFDTYFRMTIASDAISNTEVKRVLSLTENTEAFGAELQRMSAQKTTGGGSRVQQFLWLLQDHVEHDIPLVNIESIVRALVLSGDEIIRAGTDRKNWLIAFPADTVMWLTIERLLSRITEEERFKILFSAMESSKFTNTLAVVLYNLGRQHGKYLWPQEKRKDPEFDAENQQLLILEHVEQVESLVQSKIRQAAKTRALLQCRQLQFILNLWQFIAGAEEVARWTRTAFQEDNALLTILESSLNETRTTDLTYGTQSYDYHLDLKDLSKFLNIDNAYNRIDAIAQRTDLSARQRIALDKLKTAYELDSKESKSVPGSTFRLKARRKGSTRPKIRQLEYRAYMGRTGKDTR